MNHAPTLQVLAAALLAITPLFIIGRSNANQEIQLGCMSPNFHYADSNPVAAITRAIVKNTDVPRFRITWNDSLGGGYNYGTMLYNRAHGILKFSDTGGDTSSSYQQTYSFIRVSDALLLDLCRQYNTVENAKKLHPRALPILLRSRGCGVHKIVDIKNKKRQL